MDEIAKAAERRRADNYDDHEYLDGIHDSWQQIQDDRELADAFIAEHRPDDMEILTEEWLASHLLESDEWGEYLPVTCGTPGRHEPCIAFSFFDEDESEWYIYIGPDAESGVWCRRVRTRGDARGLFCELGVPLKEQS